MNVLPPRPSPVVSDMVTGRLDFFSHRQKMSFFVKVTPMGLGVAPPPLHVIGRERRPERDWLARVSVKDERPALPCSPHCESQIFVCKLCSAD